MAAPTEVTASRLIGSRTSATSVTFTPNAGTGTVGNVIVMFASSSGTLSAPVASDGTNNYTFTPSPGNGSGSGTFYLKVTAPFTSITVSGSSSGNIVYGLCEWSGVSSVSVLDTTSRKIGTTGATSYNIPSTSFSSNQRTVLLAFGQAVATSAMSNSSYTLSGGSSIFTTSTPAPLFSTMFTTWALGYWATTLNTATTDALTWTWGATASSGSNMYFVSLNGTSPAQLQATTAQNASAAGTITPANWGKAPNAGSLLIAVCTTRTASTTVHSASAGWTQIGGMLANAGSTTSMATSVWYKTATGGSVSGDLPTITWSGTLGAAIMVCEFMQANVAVRASSNSPVQFWRVKTDNTYGNPVGSMVWNLTQTVSGTGGAGLFFALVGLGADVTQTADGLEDALACSWLITENTSGTVTWAETGVSDGSTKSTLTAQTGTTGSAPRIIETAIGMNAPGAVTLTQTLATWYWTTARISTGIWLNIVPNSAQGRSGAQATTLTEAQSGNGAGSAGLAPAKTNLVETTATVTSTGAGSAAPSAAKLSEAWSNPQGAGAGSASPSATSLSEALSSPQSAGAGTGAPSPTQIVLGPYSASGAGAGSAQPSAIRISEQVTANGAAAALAQPAGMTIRLDLSGVTGKETGIPGSVGADAIWGQVKGGATWMTVAADDRTASPTIRAEVLSAF